MQEQQLTFYLRPMNTYTTNHLVFFSPTHTSAKIARAIGEGIGMGRRIETDLTLDESDTPIEINDSLTVIAAPVYGGRVSPYSPTTHQAPEREQFTSHRRGGVWQPRL